MNPETIKLMAKLREDDVLRRLLAKSKMPLEPCNSPAFRRLNAATANSRLLLEGTDEEYRVIITITTRQKDARKVMEALSRILSKHLFPKVRGYVRFFHRTARGFIHFHILAAFGVPVLQPGAPRAASRSAERHLAFRMRDFPGFCKSPTWPLSIAAREVKRKLSNAMRRAGLGYNVDIQAVDDIDSVVKYVARYLEQIARIGERYSKDRDVRLFSASKGARIISTCDHVIGRYQRLGRFKLAAYCASQGCSSLEKMKAKFGARWHYYAREKLRDIKLRVYLCEEDFTIDWGCRYTPEALGIEIRDRNYSPLTRVYEYACEQIDDSDHEVQGRLASALDVPEDVWTTP